MREAVEQNVSGFLVKAQDSESLYQAMKKMLEISTEMRATMGMAGRKKMEQEFAKERIVADTLEGMRGLL